VRLDRLPAIVQEQAARVYVLWRTDPYIPIIQACSSNESASDNPSTPFGLASATGHWDFKRQIVSIGSGSAHMPSMTN